MMAIFMAAVEATIVATALPTIVGQLGGFHLFSWVFATYLLGQAVSTPIYGRLADLYGRKRIFYLGTGIFLVGSTACGFTWALAGNAATGANWGMAALIVFRLVQGLGAGAVQAIPTTLAGDLYGPAERPRVQGWLSSVWGVAAVAGPVLGAFIVEHMHWAFVFWINLPIGFVAMALIALFLHEPVAPRRHQIDVAGSLLLMLGLGAILMVVVQGQNLGLPASAAILAAGLAALALLVVQQRRAREPVVPFRMWRSRMMRVGNAGSLVIGALLMCVVAFLPTYVQGALGRGAAFSGLLIAILSVAWSCGSIACGRMMAAMSYRTTGIIGALTLVVGTALLIAHERLGGPASLALAAALVGVGMGFCNQTFLVALQSSVGWSERGVATASILFLRTIGQAMGAGLGGAILNFGVARYAPGAGGALDRLLDPARRGELGGETLARLSGAIASSLHDVYVIAGLFAALTLVVALLIPARLSAASIDGREPRG
jgi:EmrB/QacA subfamily drug resistance transporter